MIGNRNVALLRDMDAIGLDWRFPQPCNDGTKISLMPRAISCPAMVWTFASVSTILFPSLPCSMMTSFVPSGTAWRKPGWCRERSNGRSGKPDRPIASNRSRHGPASRTLRARRRHNRQRVAGGHRTGRQRDSALGSVECIRLVDGHQCHPSPFGGERAAGTRQGFFLTSICSRAAIQSCGDTIGGVFAPSRPSWLCAKCDSLLFMCLRPSGA
jgi:hypothetical protein